MAIEITFEEALEGLRGAIALKGADYVYDTHGGCKYYKNGEPSCIVGHVLAPFGLSPDADELPDGAGVIDLWDAGILRADARTLKLLGTCQEYQDTGDTWGKSLEIALERLDLE